MKDMRFNLLLFLALLPAIGKACFNDFVHDSTGQTHIHDDLEMLRYPRNFDFSGLDKKIKKSEAKELKTYKDSSDYAVLLAKRGFVFRSLAILKELGRKYPDNYVIAANLGTSYELAGKNDSAIKWIRHGIKLNANSHQGSEWVHVKILEAKLALQLDANWLDKNKVLGLKGKAEVKQPELEHRESFSTIERHVIYQLNERLPFMSPPDQLMSSVLEELAEYESAAALEVSLLHYQLALEYAVKGKKEIQLEIKKLKTKLSRERLKRHEKYGAGDIPTPLGYPEFYKASAYAILDTALPEPPLKPEVQVATDSLKNDSLRENVKTAGKPGEGSGPSVLFWLLPVLVAGGAAAFWWIRKR